MTIIILLACQPTATTSKAEDFAQQEQDGLTEQTDTSTSNEQETGTPNPTEPTSAGCGIEPIHALGGEQLTVEWQAAGGSRSFYLSLPLDYDPNLAHRLVMGFSGTNWLGAQIQGYLDLEAHAEQTIFVYPDPLWRDFDGWGNYGGWLLGPHAYPAQGEEDLLFVEQIIDTLGEQYCIDQQRIFATGHSWGGDMAQVVACFLGERFRASVPIAANRPYWFWDAQNSAISCSGEAAVWTLFGEADDHFVSQSYPGQYGEECRDFWIAERNCAEEPSEFMLGNDICYDYQDCDSPVRYCLYDAEYGHQSPADHLPQATMQWFQSF